MAHDDSVTKFRCPPAFARQSQLIRAAYLKFILERRWQKVKKWQDYRLKLHSLEWSRAFYWPCLVHRRVFWEKASCGALWLTVDAPLPSPAHPSEIHPDWWWHNKADVLLSFHFCVFHFFILTRITLNRRFHFSGMVIKKETYCNKKKKIGKVMLSLLCVAGKDDQLPDI